jgi:hypothetical protein
MVPYQVLRRFPHAFLLRKAALKRFLSISPNPLIYLLTLPALSSASGHPPLRPPSIFKEDKPVPQQHSVTFSVPSLSSYRPARSSHPPSRFDEIWGRRRSLSRHRCRCCLHVIVGYLSSFSLFEMYLSLMFIVCRLLYTVYCILYYSRNTQSNTYATRCIIIDCKVL